MKNIIWLLIMSACFRALAADPVSLTLNYVDISDRASQAIAVPPSGSHEMRVLSSSLLEVYIVSERDGHAARPTYCDWVDDDGIPIPGALPLAGDVEVKVNGVVTTVSAIGFKRHVRYAPLGQSNFFLENFIYISLATPAGSGATVEVTTPTGKWPSSFVLSADNVDDRWSPALHTNQVGYEIGAKKTAHVGYWLGTLHEIPVTSATFEIIDAATGAVATSGSLVHKTEVGFDYSSSPTPPPLPYQHVYEADFSSLDTAGQYRFKVPGLGASYPFEIREGIDGVFARNFAAGMLHQRSGYDHKLPHTRFEDGPGHTAPAEIPSNTDRAAYQQLWDFLQNQTGGVVSGPTDLLTPYVNTGTVDVSGGHHDAGDYSKYTTSVAQMVHHLTFAVDGLAGVQDLDNLGIPESGDGISDLLQEAKWEADFLAKMQDADGGFYYTVFPKTRRFENDVLPSGGDTQIVLPKNSVATAAAVGALAEIGSSPAFRAAFGAAAGDAYLAKALSGWNFLVSLIDTNTDNSFSQAEIDAGYQRFAHFGDAFGSKDELAWAAAAMFAATGDSIYEAHLKQLAPDPSSSDLIALGYLQLWEGWGAAFRAYSFAHRTGRLSPSDYDSAYLALVDAELVSAGDNVVLRSSQSTYGIGLDEKQKLFLNPSYVFGNSLSFDALVAMQINPAGSDGYNDTIRYQLNYTAGNNPVNAPFLTGIGWNQRREIVSQFSSNDGFVLPPIGIPVGNVQRGMPYLGDYLTSFGGNLLQRSMYPATNGFIFSLYDIWADTFEPEGETTVPQLSRGAAVTAWLFAQGPLKTQAWNSDAAILTGVPSVTTINVPLTATIQSSLDLTGAKITWEGSGVEPCHGGTSFTFAPTLGGDNHVAADILFPDGRRVYALQRFAADGNSVAANGEYLVDGDTVALYHFNGDYQDASGNGYHLAPTGGVTRASDNLGWMNTPSGEVARFSAIGDFLDAAIPDSAILPGAGHELTIEARIFPRNYLGYSIGSPTLVGLTQEYDAGYSLTDQTWGNNPKGPILGANGSTVADASTWSGAAPLNQWSLLRIVYDGANKVDAYVDNVLIGSVNDAPNSTRTNDWTALIGNFDGDIDELRISCVVRSGVAPLDTVGPCVLLTTANTEVEGSFDVDVTFTESVTGFDASDVVVTNGSVGSVTGSGANYTVTISPTSEGFVNVEIAGAAANDAAGNASKVSNEIVVDYTLLVLPDEYAVDGDTIALYHFSGNYEDSSGNGYHLSASGSPSLASDNLTWMASPSGSAVRFSQLGDQLAVTIPDAALLPISGQAISLEARIYSRNFLAYGYGTVPVVALYQEWDTSMGAADTKWGYPKVPTVLGGITQVVGQQKWSDCVSNNAWHLLQVVFDGSNNLTAFIDGQSIGSATVNFNNTRTNPWYLLLGNFDGDIDEVRVSSVARAAETPSGGSGTNDTTPPAVTISAPSVGIPAPFQASIRFTEPVSGLTIDDLVVYNGTASGLSGSSDHYTVTITPGSTGNVSIFLREDRVNDAGGNGNVASNLLEVIHTAPGSPAADEEKISDPATVALYPLNGNFDDASGNGYHLNASNGVTFTSSDLSWMGSPSGSAARFSGFGDTISVNIPDSEILPSGGRPFSVEAWVLPRAYSGWGIGNLSILSLRQEWDSSLEVRDRKWGSNPFGPNVSSGITEIVDAQTWSDLATPGSWHHVTMSYDGHETVKVLIDGQVANVAIVRPHEQRTNDWALTIGNFDGDVDDVRVSSIDRGPLGGVRQNGLTADYYEGANFEELRFTQIDDEVDFSWAAVPDARLGNGDISVRWRGCVVPPTSDNYTFHVTAGDGARIWLGDELIADNWAAGPGTVSGTASMVSQAATQIVIETSISSANYPAVAILEWEAPGLARQVIPMSDLLINETLMDPYQVLGYPTTWGEWVASERNPDKYTSPLSNRDGDAYSDLLEYAFGESPSTGVHAYPGFRLDTSRGSLDAVYERPLKLQDVNYTLQASYGLDEWFDLSGDNHAKSRNLGNGMEQLRFEDVNIRPQSLNPGSPVFFRLRVDVTKWGE